MRSSIFIIDDEPVDRLIAQKVISAQYTQNQIHCFESAGGALTKLTWMAQKDVNSFPGLIFLDINMPVMNGFTFLEHFSLLPPSLLENCSVIMLSSSINERDISTAISYPMVKTYIVKPLTGLILDKITAIQLSNRLPKQTLN